MSVSEGDTDQPGLCYVGGQPTDQAPVISRRVPEGRRETRGQRGAGGPASTLAPGTPQSPVKALGGRRSSTGPPAPPGAVLTYGMTLMSSLP